MWNLQSPNAALVLEAASASLSLQRPEQGLADWQLRGRAIDQAAVLGLDFAATTADSPPLEDHYVRGDDLVCAFGPKSDWPYFLDATWSRIEAPGTLAALELVVSIRTELLEARPEFRVRSRLVAPEAFQLVESSHAPRFDAVLPDHDKPLLLQPEEATPCLLFRLPGEELSYAEMAHPADFQNSQLSLDEAERGPSMNLTHRWSLDHLEKGVILRGRVRGLWLARSNDQEQAAACYRDLVAAAPPLST
jgi:hypothetical protein